MSCGCGARFWVVASDLSWLMVTEWLGYENTKSNQPKDSQFRFSSFFYVAEFRLEAEHLQEQVRHAETEAEAEDQRGTQI